MKVFKLDSRSGLWVDECGKKFRCNHQDIGRLELVRASSDALDVPYSFVVPSFKSRQSLLARRYNGMSDSRFGGFADDCANISFAASFSARNRRIA